MSNVPIVTARSKAPGRYILTVGALYALTFLCIFLIIDEWPAYPPAIGIISVVGMSLFMSFVFTVRIQRLWPESKNPFFAPSLVHGVVILAMLISALTI